MCFLGNCNTTPGFGFCSGACTKLLGTNAAELQSGDKEEVAKIRILHCSCTMCTELCAEKNHRCCFLRNRLLNDTSQTFFQYIIPKTCTI